MHAIPRAREETWPCNAYCQGDVHVDVDYAHPGRGQTRHSLLDALRQSARLNRVVEILAIVPAPEAVPAHQRYPATVQRLATWGLAPEAWVPFRLTYRVRAQGPHAP